MGRRFATGALLSFLCVGCGPKNPDAILPPPEESAPRGTYDPNSGCQKAMSHVIDLTVHATGAGPTNTQRGEFIRRCVEAANERGNHCILALKRLPGKRGGQANFTPAWRCLSRR